MLDKKSPGMPLTPVHVWEETPEAITITVQLPGVLKRNAIVTSGDLLLTINATPYVLHLDLHKEVDQTQSSIVLGDGKAVATLVKARPALRCSEGRLLGDNSLRMLQAEEGMWGKLLCEGSKQDIQSRRQASLARLHKLADQEREEGIKLKHKLQRCAQGPAAMLLQRLLCLAKWLFCS